MFSIGSLFSGIGGLDLAAHWAGFDTKWFVEKEPFCQKVLAKHWPNVPILDDVFTCDHPPYVDVIVGGFPCQPFSVAGNRKGKDDERYLLPEMLRIVDEVKPYAVLFENVPGFPSLNDGAEFKYLLRTLAEMGFDAQWGHLRASDVGAPHKRERWFCVAYVVNPSQHISGNKSKGNAIQLQQTIDRATDKRTDREPLHEKELGNTDSRRCEQYDTKKRQLRVSNAGCNDMGYAERGGLGWVNGRRSGSQLADGYTQSGQGQVKSQLGGITYGVSSGMDGDRGRGNERLINSDSKHPSFFTGFPARPGEPQHAYEPPRTAPSTPTTNARIKALGNAVVPQVAYPIFQALAEWMEESTLTEDDPL